MALYEYVCPACGKCFQLMRPMSDALESAACPQCSAEAQRVMSMGPGVENPTQPAARPPGSESETSIPGRSAGSAAVITSTATREEIADHPEVDVEEDTEPLEMPWLTESQPGGGNLWYIRDWGIASMLGYLRKGIAAGIEGGLSLPVAAVDADPADSHRYGLTPDEHGLTQGGPDLATRRADNVEGHPSFSEWRAAVSIMPWLLETDVEPSEAVSESPDPVSEDADKPGLRPRRGRAAAHLTWAGWLNSRPAGKRASDASTPRSRPGKEGRIGVDFPAQVIEAAWRRQGGRCAGCGRWLIWSNRDRDSGIGAWESHHRVPVDQGGSSLLANCVLFCSSVADCHFNLGHGGIGWTHYAPLDEPGPLFLFAGSTTAAVPTTAVRPRRSLLRDVLGIPQVGRDREGSRDAAGESGSTG